MQKEQASNSDDHYFLQAMAELTDQMVFAYRLDTQQLVYLNPSFEKFWQQSRESIIAQPITLLQAIHPDDQDFVKSAYQQIMQGAKLKDIEFRLRLADESVRWLSVTPFLLGKQEEGMPSPNNQQLLAGYAQDITAYKAHQETLEKYALKKNAILDILSHDITLPLANIKSLSNLLVKRLKPSKEDKIKELIEMIRKTSEQGINLIHDFVNEEFLASAKVQLVKKRVDIVDRVRGVIEQFQGSEQVMQKRFQLFTSEKSIFCEIDTNKFMQVITNLISNANKFTPEGGEIIVRLEDQTDQVLVQVADNGIGIPAHLQEGLFEKFTKARRPGLKGEPSHGLGMSIIKSIVEWHKAKIWFESEVNKGTTFYIQLPKQQH